MDKLLLISYLIGNATLKKVVQNFRVFGLLIYFFEQSNDH